MQVVIRKPDLDTCLTALILGVKEDDPVTVVQESTPDIYLNDPNVLCIEAGGNGRTDLNNFDHHDPYLDLPPACIQAFRVSGIDDSYIKRVVEYVAMVDGYGSYKKYLDKKGCYLSNIFSGFLFCTENARDQFRGGVKLLKQFINYSLDPFETIHVFPCWKRYYRLWSDAKKITAKAAKKIEVFRTQSGQWAGFFENSTIGGFGHLYHAGCHVGILYNPAFGQNAIQKFTIGSAGFDLSPLLLTLNSLEKGWGGRSTIIGSPLSGSMIEPAIVKDAVKRWC